MRRQLPLVLCLFALLGGLLAPRVAAQSGGNLVEIQVDAAYSGFFRDDQWFPIRVTVTNNSDPIDGRIIVRPATSRGVRGAFSVPFDLPTNAVKTDTLYVAAQGLATELRVELIDNADDLVLASQTVPLRALQPTDQLYIVVTESAAGSVDLSNARASGMGAAQANWTVAAIPDNPVALASVNMILFTDVNTAGLTLAQEAALEAWVANGGHLVVTGGVSWERTAAGLQTLLPLVPDDSVTVDDVTPLAAFIGSGDVLAEDTTLALGDLTDDARILAETGLREPLLARREIGEGVVDYLTLDPNTAPLRSWSGMPDLWYTLAATAPPVPAWSRNFSGWEGTVAAAEILPGIEVLPSVLPICGFLALYIALIGPLNYLVLNRINRREWAWLSIPVFIVLFSVLAFVVGGQLRGTIASIGRISVVRSWQNTDIAHTTEVVGLLSPQRTQYSMTAADGTLMRSLPRNNLSGGGSLLASTFQTSVEFEQTETFRAVDFPVDASFVAGFATYGTAPAPDITGNANIFYPVSERSAQLVRGSVRNNTDQTLTDGVILARGVTFRLANPLAPGDVVDFEMRLDTFESPAPAPLGFTLGGGGNNLGFSYSGLSQDRTVRDILGEENYNINFNQGNNTDANLTTDRQEQRRRQLFLSALVQEPYLSTARGNDVYFVGWGQSEPTALELVDRDYNAYPTTAYIVSLDVTVEQPLNKRVRVASDQFTWAVHAREGLGTSAPINFTVGEGNTVAFRYTPLPDARLDEVESLWIIIQRSTGSSATLPVEVWNWEEQTWDRKTVSGNQLEIDDPAPYLGPGNTAIIQLRGDDVSFMSFSYIRVEHVGTFSG